MITNERNLRDFIEDFFYIKGFKVIYCPLLLKALVIDKENNMMLFCARDNSTIECYDGPNCNTLFRVLRLTHDPLGNLAWEVIYDRFN